MVEPTEPAGAPQSQRDLVAGCVLLLLAESRSHGYELHERMRKLMPLWSVTAGNVYRELRRMETEGLLRSVWEVSQTRGPVRRVYELTGTGRAALDEWATEVVGLIEMLDGCLNLHTTVTLPAPNPRGRQRSRA